MNARKEISMKSRHVFSVLAATLLLGGCATASSPPRAHGPEPAACNDSLYVQLARQHPDSLSDRAWLRLQSLDSACVRARTQSANDPHGMGMMGMGRGQNTAWTFLAPLIVVGMAVMMVTFGF
jgi:hypothetical protein